MSKIGHSLIWVSVTLLLLHSFTPHHHMADLSERAMVRVEHKCPSGFLSDIFKFDPGFHHLEEYQISRHDAEITSIRFEVLWTTASLGEQVEIKTSGGYIVHGTSPLIDLYFQGSRLLRAPPTLMG